MTIPRRLGLALAGLTILATVAACTGASGGTGGTAAPVQPAQVALVGRQFLSVGVTDAGAIHQLVAGTRISLTFRATDLSAQAGCNTMGGTFRLDGAALILAGLAMTDMGCNADLGAQDAWLAQILSSKPALRLSGNELFVMSGTTQIHLLDRTVVDPDRPLVGTTWTVDSIISRAAVSSIPSDAQATLVFNADGTVTVFTGCNQGAATWSGNGGEIAVSDLVLTKKACTGSGGQLEAAVVALLRASAIDVSIKASELTLLANGTGLGLHAR